VSEPQDDFDEFLDMLRQQRDELRVQMHLAKAEAKEEWEKVDKQWQGLKQRTGGAQDELKAGGENILAAARLLGEEVQQGLARVRKILEK